MHSLVPPRFQRMANDGPLRDEIVGAVLIVDVEGSTRLSASLQRYGTAGAEAQAEVLQRVFTPMVEHVAGCDGVVAEFAGDGIVAVFPGEPELAVPNAVRAAQGIMSKLSAMGDLETPEGAVALTVRASVGAGALDLIVWTSQRSDVDQKAAYTVRGAALAEAQRGEALARGGVLAVGPDARRHLPVGLENGLLADGFASVDVVTSEGAAPAANRASGVPRSGVSFYPAILEDVPQGGEFRDVVSVFVEFSELPDDGPDSPMSHLLDLVADHRGYLCNVVPPGPESAGVRALIFWGAPTSRERDIGYALRCLADLNAVVDPDTIRAGVTRSTVFAGFVGTELQSSYTGIGSGVNLASRMCASADWGDVWVDAEIESQLDAPWVLDDLGPIEYRGFDKPIRTHRIVYVPPVRAADPFEGVFVGRGRELDELEDVLAPLWSGRPAGIVAVVGEAGSGKSRLIGELRERLMNRDPEPTWLEARADAIRSQPLATLRDALTGYFGRPGESETGSRLDEYMQQVESRAPEFSHALARSRKTLGELLDSGGRAARIDPKVRFESLVVAVEDLVLALEKDSPVIISVADAQWIDGGTAEILARICDELATSRIAVLVETRDVEAGIPPDHRVDLDPLGDDEIKELATRLLGTKPSPDLVAFVSDRSNGNIFYARQLLQYLERESLVESVAGFSNEFNRADVPLDLRRMLVSRLDGLPAPARRAVQVASVLGREIDLRVLRSMVDHPESILSHVEAATSARIWSVGVDDTVTFSSLLVRDAAYGMLVHADARILHEAAAHAIEALSEPEERSAAALAFHYDNAGLPDVAAVHYLAAGRVAAARFANTEALEHLDRAYELSGDWDPQRRIEILFLAYNVHDVLGARDDQKRVLARMDALGVDAPVTVANIAVLRGRLLSSTGSYAEAESIVRATQGRIESDLAPAERGELVFLLAQLARYQGNTERAEASAATARSLYAETGDALRLATVDDFLGGIAWDRGDFEAAAALHRSAATTFAEHNRATEEIAALNNLGSALFAIGDYSEARVIHEAGALRSREIGYRMGEGDHLDNTGGTAWAVGDYELATERYSEALAIRDRMNDAWGVAISKGNLGATRRALGLPAEALGLYREALEIDRAIGRRRGEAYDHHGMGLCYLDLSRLNLASESLAHAASIRDELGEKHLANESRAACAVAMHRRGDGADAVALIDAVLESEGPNPFDGAVETTASLLRCIEILADSDPDRAEALRSFTAERVASRAEKISDPSHRLSYMQSVDSHRTALGSPR